MRSFYFLFFILLFSSISSSAQNFNLGVKGSLGGAFFKSSNNKSFLESYSIGGLGNYKLSTHLSLQAELLFSKKGSANRVKYTNDSGNLAGESMLRYNLYYIELPFLIKFTTKGESKRIYCMTGVSPAFFLGNAKIHSPGESKIANANSFDVGWINCIGLEVNAGKKLSFVELRINNGLINIVDNFAYKNFTYGLCAGIHF